MDSPARAPPRAAATRSRAESRSTTSSVDSHPSRNLLFGEIESNASCSSGKSLRLQISTCNLVRSTNPTFLRFWESEACRYGFLVKMDTATLRSLRLVCHDFSSKAAPLLFHELSVNFRPTSFTKLRRLTALKRIGHHAKTFIFRMQHSSDTTLPPLLHPESGEQFNFTYIPQVDRPAGLEDGQTIPKYGSEEVTRMLIEQYPPLFHAATNIPAFFKALSCMRNLKHITIACPSKSQPQLHRRSIVDYALISLRIAIERAPLDELISLTLESIHPAALLYLQPIGAVGSTPASRRRWSQIEKLYIHMTCFPFHDPDQTEHLRILHAYIRAFSANLTNIRFSWVGNQLGPSPLTLDTEPILQFDNRTKAPLKPLRFPRLEYMDLRNAIMDSSQVASFISKHRKRLVEFNFEDVTLRDGDWAHALEPLRKHRHRKDSLVPSELDTARLHESMEVPCKFRPVPIPPEPRIEGPLEPQERYRALPHRGFRMPKWLGGKPERRLQRKDWREPSGSHFKRVLKSTITWR